MVTEQEPNLSRRSRDDHTDHERIPLKHIISKDSESLEISTSAMTTAQTLQQQNEHEHDHDHEQSSIGPSRDIYPVTEILSLSCSCSYSSTIVLTHSTH